MISEIGSKFPRYFVAKDKNVSSKYAVFIRFSKEPADFQSIQINCTLLGAHRLALAYANGEFTTPEKKKSESSA